MGNKVNKRVFISYSHKDLDWLAKIQTFLKRIEVNCDVILWNDDKIQAGTNWRAEIKKEIQSCDAALLLITEEFIASDFINKNELPPLLERASEKRGMLIFPLVLEP
ncbi:MAG: hypothetical protein DIZ77_11735 [endosymbiont of Seepiophila jonesi]|uniref:TIR domain-containing protein n=1 Tax=endosymbiont of Lamellibrachia luymesi TaxID=2200907 RepID=A0A370E4F5_9GAMM|nr:MAG: hypothetical protein DIZ77_11735 [endosymbiont of Seepiophila jonesi]RDH93553.1 MAG: hypothetical protein DIZ79_00130 [endosymbiont of Lamellibrachia luymesi]